MTRRPRQFGVPPRRAAWGAAALAAATPRVREEEEAAASASADSFAPASTLLEKFAPVAAEIFNTTAMEDVAVLRAKIKNNEALRDKFPEPLKTFYRNEVRKLKAKLSAKIEAANEERITTQSKREWANLGKAAVVVGILVGVAVVGGIIKRT